MNPAVESLRQVVSAYQADNGGRVAAAIAFKTMFAMAPALLLAVSVAGFVYGEGDVQRQLIGQVEDVAGSTVAELVSDMLDQAVSGRQVTGVVGLVLLAWTASGLFLELESALNAVFRTQGQRVESGLGAFLKKRLAAVLIAVGMGVVLIAALSVNLLSDMAAEWMDWPDAVATALRWAGPTGSLAILIGLFTLVLRYVPRREIPWSPALRGAGIAALGFVLASVALGRYFSPDRFSSTGFAGGFVLVLFSVYVLAQISLFAAEVVSVLWLDSGGGSTHPDKAADEAVRTPPPGGIWVFALGILTGLALGFRNRD